MKSAVTKQFIVTILLIFLLQAVMLVYIFSSFYRTAADDVKALGESNLKSQATMIENVFFSMFEFLLFVMFGSYLRMG